MKDLVHEIWPWGSSMPPQKERINLLNDFKEAHSRSFQKAIHCEILLRGGLDKFDFKISIWSSVYVSVPIAVGILG